MKRFGKIALVALALGGTVAAATVPANVAGTTVRATGVAATDVIRIGMAAGAATGNRAL